MNVEELIFAAEKINQKTKEFQQKLLLYDAVDIKEITKQAHLAGFSSVEFDTTGMCKENVRRYFNKRLFDPWVIFTVNDKLFFYSKAIYTFSNGYICDIIVKIPEQSISPRKLFNLFVEEIEQSINKSDNKVPIVLCDIIVQYLFGQVPITF
jgi:hypothetical protein